jgi:hypothetical protein
MSSSEGESGFPTNLNSSALDGAIGFKLTGVAAEDQAAAPLRARAMSTAMV